MKEIISGQGTKKNHTVKTGLKWKMCKLRKDLRKRSGETIPSTNGFVRPGNKGAWPLCSGAAATCGTCLSTPALGPVSSECLCNTETGRQEAK